MKKLLLVIVGVLVLLVLVLSVLPARFVWEKWFEQHAHHVQLQGVSGQWWKGRAANVSWYNRSIGQLSWQPQGLGLQLQLEQQQAQVSGRLVSVDTVKSQLFLRDLNGSMDVALLPTGWQQTLIAMGDIAFQLATVKIQKDQQLHIHGQSLWRDAALSGDVVLDLGEIQMDFSPHEQHTRLQMINRNSQDIRLTGNGEIHVDHYEIQLRLRALPNKTQLQQQLRQLGPITADGSVMLNFAGRF